MLIQMRLFIKRFFGHGRNVTIRFPIQWGLYDIQLFGMKMYQKM